MGAVQESHGRKKNTQVLAAMVFLFLSKWIETTFENLNASMSYIYRATIVIELPLLITREGFIILL